MSPSSLRLIALHDSVNDSLALASQLRNAGIQANMRHAEDLPDLHELLREENPDLILHLVDLPEPRLAEVVATSRGCSPAIPVLGMTTSYSMEALLGSIAEGARDLIDLNQPAHVLHVIQREAAAVRDARRLVQLETLSQDSEKRCHALMESSRDAIAYVHGGMHVHANAVYLETFGFAQFDDMEGSTLLDLVDAEDQQRMRDYLRSQGGEGATSKLDEVRFRSRNGSAFTASLELSPATIDGEPCTQVLIRTQADTHALEEQINFLSQRDLQTGLYNRQYFLDQLEAQLGKVRGGSPASALVHLQITHVADLKAKLGVAGLDALITEVGKLIQKIVGQDVLLSRYSAHAFALLLPEQGGQSPEAYALRILAGVTQHIFEVDGHSATVKAAAGISVLDPHTPSVNELLNRAERATLDAEEKATDRVAVYTPKEGEISQAEADGQWNRVLQNALTEDRFRLLFQPILNLMGDNGRQRYETFLRLLGEDGEAISPGQFMAAAERTGISHAMDRWVIQHALRTIGEARQRGLNPQIFARISGSSIVDPEFPAWLSGQLISAQVHDGSLVLELNEKVATEYLKQVSELQPKLAELACPLLIDGFGLGDEPFRILNYVEAEWLKLDRGLMESFATNKANQAKVREMIKAAQQHGARQLIVANVENASTLQLVLADGADFVQGHFIQAPMERLEFNFNAF